MTVPSPHLPTEPENQPAAMIVIRMIQPGRATKPVGIDLASNDWEQTLDIVVTDFRIEGLRWKAGDLHRQLEEALREKKEPEA